MYEALFTSIEIPTENNDEVYGYELVLQKSVDAYYKVLLLSPPSLLLTSTTSTLWDVQRQTFHVVQKTKKQRHLD